MSNIRTKVDHDGFVWIHLEDFVNATNYSKRKAKQIIQLYIDKSPAIFYDAPYLFMSCFYVVLKRDRQKILNYELCANALEEIEDIH